MFLYNKKITAIPPLSVNSKFVSDFSTKAYPFNDFFPSIFTPINTESTIPPLTYKTKIRINFLRINHNDISSIIKNLDSSKAHGCENISTKTIQICGES